MAIGNWQLKEGKQPGTLALGGNVQETTLDSLIQENRYYSLWVQKKVARIFMAKSEVGET